MWNWLSETNTSWDITTSVRPWSECIADHYVTVFMLFLRFVKFKNKYCNECFLESLIFRYAVKHALWIFQMIFMIDLFTKTFQKINIINYGVHSLKKIIRKACARDFSLIRKYCGICIVYTMTLKDTVSLQKRVGILSDSWWCDLIVIDILVKILSKKFLNYFTIIEVFLDFINGNIIIKTVGSI